MKYPLAGLLIGSAIFLLYQSVIFLKAEYFFLHSEIQVVQQADSHTSNRYERARQLLNESLHHRADNARVHIALANNQESSLRDGATAEDIYAVYHQAARHYGRALLLQPMNAVASTGYALAQSVTGLPDNTLADKLIKRVLITGRWEEHLKLRIAEVALRLWPDLSYRYKRSIRQLILQWVRKDIRLARDVSHIATRVGRTSVLGIEFFEKTIRE